MIKRTIEISQQAVYLSARSGQLVVQPFDQPKDQATYIPAEDIGMVVIDQPQVTCSVGSLQTLVDKGACVVICGRNHLPAGIMLPVSSNTQQVERLRCQIQATKPRVKQLWKQLVVAKVKAQAANIKSHKVSYQKLCNLAAEVKSGDTTNVEAQGAKIYWACWRERFKNFYRDMDGDDPINVHLNYGYAILRAATARAIVAAGLHPALGLHHCNRANAFCLADDLIEPLRPLIDHRVYHLMSQSQQEIDQSSKAHLLTALTSKCTIDTQQGPLMVQLHRLVASLVNAYSSTEGFLSIPWPAELEE